MYLFYTTYFFKTKAMFPMDNFTFVHELVNYIAFIAKYLLYLLWPQSLQNNYSVPFQNWHFSSNSIHYLLSLWQRLCTAVPYVKSDKAHYLPVYAPQISKTFLKTRLEMAVGVIR